MPKPLCAFYSADTASVVKAFVDKGIMCPRKILIRSDTHLLEPANPEALENINTPEDLARTGIKVAS